jgi:predicted DNA-binding transcriptional regulator YafY
MSLAEKTVTINYTNYRGVTADRNIVPKGIFFGTTKFHTQKQWMLHAYDVAKQDYRDFALRDIHNWGEVVNHEAKNITWA